MSRSSTLPPAGAELLRYLLDCRGFVVGSNVARELAQGETPMLDALEPWMVRSAVVISALFLFDAALCVLNVWLERRQCLTEGSPHNRERARSAAA